MVILVPGDVSGYDMENLWVARNALPSYSPFFNDSLGS